MNDNLGLPAETEAEVAVAGAILRNNKAFEIMKSKGMTGEMFTTPAIRTLVNIMNAIDARSGRTPRALDVQKYLRTNQVRNLTQEDLQAYAKGYTSDMDTDRDCAMIIDAYARKQMMTYAQRTIDLLKDQSESIDNVKAYLTNTFASVDLILSKASPDKGNDVDQWIFDTSDDIMEPRWMFSIGGVGAMPEGSITALTGKAKAGKSNFLMVLMGSMITGRPFAGITPAVQLANILFVDTEQPKHAIQQKFRRMLRTFDMDIHTRLADVGIHLLSMRDATIDIRRTILNKAIHKFRPQMVIVDGIVDLIHDFNNINESEELIAELMNITASGITLIALLHENEGNDKMRGHLGTMLLQKCDDRFSVTKGKRAFTIKHKGRNAEINDIGFVIESGMYKSADITGSEDFYDEAITERIKIVFKAKDTTEMRYTELKNAYAEQFQMEERIARKDVDAARAKEVIIKYDRQDRNAPYHINMRYIDGG